MPVRQLVDSARLQFDVPGPVAHSCIDNLTEGQLSQVSRNEESFATQTQLGTEYEIVKNVAIPSADVEHLSPSTAQIQVGTDHVAYCDTTVTLAIATKVEYVSTEQQPAQLSVQPGGRK